MDINSCIRIALNLSFHTDGLLGITRTCFQFYPFSLSFFFCQAGIGGPLVDLSGNFIGMNFFFCENGMNFYDKEETPFLLRNDILECLRQFETRVCS
jgi:hypothetical protein